MVRSCASETLVSLLHSELLKIFKYCIVVRSVVRWKRKSCATCHVCLPYLQFWLWSITASKSWRHEMWVPESQLKPGKPCIQQPHFPKQAVTIQDPPMPHTTSFSQGQHQTYVSYEIHFDPTVLSDRCLAILQRICKDFTTCWQDCSKCWSMLQ